MLTDLTALKKVPTFSKLDAVAGKRAVFSDGTLAGAMYFMTPLSLDYVLENLTPQLEKRNSNTSHHRCTLP